MWSSYSKRILNHRIKFHFRLSLSFSVLPYHWFWLLFAWRCFLCYPDIIYFLASYFALCVDWIWNKKKEENKDRKIYASCVCLCVCVSENCIDYVEMNMILNIHEQIDCKCSTIRYFFSFILLSRFGLSYSFQLF